MDINEAAIGNRTDVFNGKIRQVYRRVHALVNEGHDEEEPVREQVRDLLASATAGTFGSIGRATPQGWRTHFTRSCPRTDPTDCTCRQRWNNLLVDVTSDVNALCDELQAADLPVRQRVALDQEWEVPTAPPNPNEEGMSAALRRVLKIDYGINEHAAHAAFGIAAETLDNPRDEESLAAALQRICDLDPEPEDTAGHTARGIAAEALERFTQPKE
jgi:hypothetical protein